MTSTQSLAKTPNCLSRAISSSRCRCGAVSASRTRARWPPRGPVLIQFSAAISAVDTGRWAASKGGRRGRCPRIPPSRSLGEGSRPDRLLSWPDGWAGTGSNHLAVSAVWPSSGSVRDRPPAPHPPCSVGCRRTCHRDDPDPSGSVRTSGHNAGTIATAGSGEGSPDEVAGLPEHSSDTTTRLRHGAGSSSGSCWTLMRGIVCGAPGSPAQRRRQGKEAGHEAHPVCCHRGPARPGA
jgi:hypothetical protein